MIRQLGIILGIGGLITTSTSVAVAQNTNQVIQQNGERYLYNIENRSIAKDFDEFFLETSPSTRFNYPDGSIENRSQNQRTPQLLDNIRIEIGDDSPNNNVDIFPNSRGGDRSDDSQILYEVEEW